MRIIGANIRLAAKGCFGLPSGSFVFTQMPMPDIFAYTPH